MKITKQELANIIKEEVEKATIPEQRALAEIAGRFPYGETIGDADAKLDAAEQAFSQSKSANDLAQIMPIVFNSIRDIIHAVLILSHSHEEVRKIASGKKEKETKK